ncbi:MAG: tetratricopeptide repeat protein [Candidatus Azobacteroides sp.]|nr:tetratricopeptide repeat protein [Candidatus Azobacteroides sp.]
MANSKPNFTEAEKLMTEAKNDPETMDNPETWYVSGSLEDKIFSTENSKLLLKQTPDEPVMYEALIKSYGDFLKTIDLEKIPNEKGKVNNKFTKQVKSILKVDHPYYVNAGAYYYDKRAYDKAYEAFNIYLDIPKMDIFKGEKLVEDSTYNQIMFYAAYSAGYAGDSINAVKLLEILKDKDYEKEQVYASLSDEYRDMKDTVKFMNILKEGSQLFPKNLYFIQSLINLCINSGQIPEAMIYLDDAIKQDPTEPQYWRVKGDLYEADKNFDKALDAYQESLKINPEYTAAIGSIGRLYYNQGFDIQSKANEKSIRESQAEMEKAKDFYKKALPYLEKAHQADPTERQYILALYGVYYALNMPQMDEMEKLLNDTGN